MTDFEETIRKALRGDADDPNREASNTAAGMVLESFRGASRTTTLFAWMKMLGTLGIAMVAALTFFAVDSTRAQIASAACFTVGFTGFGMWWIWYWMFLNRNSTLREIKRMELQIAELRESGREPAASP